jgi:hypothetical protein
MNRPHPSPVQEGLFGRGGTVTFSVTFFQELKKKGRPPTKKGAVSSQKNKQL